VFSVSDDVCCWWFRSVKTGDFVISFSGSYVLCRFIAPCNCDSDERLDCFWSPVVVSVDVVSTGYNAAWYLVRSDADLEPLVKAVQDAVAEDLLCEASVVVGRFPLSKVLMGCWVSKGGEVLNVCSGPTDRC